MKKIYSITLKIFILIFLLQSNGCKKEKGVTEPENNIPINGGNYVQAMINLPSDSSGFSNLAVGFGQEEYRPDNEGKINMSCNTDVPGLAIVYDKDDIPLLLALVPNPKESKECLINVHSTALALVFISPFICTSDPVNASTVIKKLELLPELKNLESILKQKLLANTKVLINEDAQIENALKNTVVSYINLASPDTARSLEKLNKIREDFITIEPVNIVSGHQVRHLGENKFTVSNWYGRWAKCITPGDTLYVPPNNDFLSLNPWAASEQSFNLEIIPNEPHKKINIYGLGRNNDMGTPWSGLTEEEKDHVIFAGKMTVLIEFLPRILSLVTNFPFTFGNGNAAVATAGNILRWQIQYAKNWERAKLQLANGDFYGFYWTQIKEYISLIVTDDDFRKLVLTGAGIKLTKAAFENLGKFILLPLNVLYIADDLTGLAKTTLGLINAGYKTTFEVYSEEYKFGNVNGNVYDKESGSPIQGVKVQLTGDENNPMNPSYIYTTDASGGFWFENIMTGKKSLLISKEKYGSKSVEIEVKENEVTEVTIELSKEKGTITGKVLNEIFVKNGITPANFNKECHLDIKEIGGNNQSYSFWIFESEKGVYSKQLTPGTYEIKAWHEDYKEATVTVTIPGNETTHVKDLILKPDCKMEGSIYYDIDFNGKAEYSYSFKADTSGGTKVMNIGTCPNNQPRYGLSIGGINQDEIIEILIDTSQVKESGSYNIGGMDNCGCAGLNGRSTVYVLTHRFKCKYNENQSDLVFGLIDDPNDQPCNCGITNGGDLVLDRFGNQLTDVIAGLINVKLAGWKNCHCSCCDEQGNYTVDCATVTMELSFKIIIGSFFNEGSSQKILKNRIKNL